MTPPDLLVSTVRHHTLGFILLASIHVHPDLDYRGRRAVVVNLTTLATYLRPALELIGGDFNMSITDPRKPLAPACRAQGCVRRYRRAPPPHTPTRFTSTNGRRSATAIDHIYLRGAPSVPDADVLSSPTPTLPGAGHSGAHGGSGRRPLLAPHPLAQRPRRDSAPSGSAPRSALGLADHAPPHP